MEEKEILFLNAFNSIPGVGATTIRALNAHFGSYAAAWRADVSAYAAARLDPQAHDALVARKNAVDPERAMQSVGRAGVWVITDRDPVYPLLLSQIYSPPVILYGKGKKEALSPAHGIAIVGTRRPTPYGIEATETIAAALTEAGVAVISGLATGIDTKSHKTALERGGATVAVLGSGIDSASLFPPENRALADRIAASSGAVISEYAPGTPAVKEHFPMRNRIIAGLAQGTLVTEAREKSGALITARAALEQNRDVFAVPGSIFSAASDGPNILIREGAKAVRRAADILEEYGIDAEAAGRAHHTASLTAPESVLLNALLEPLDIDALKIKTGFSIQTILSSLSRLELKGLTRNLGGDTFHKI